MSSWEVGTMSLNFDGIFLERLGLDCTGELAGGGGGLLVADGAGVAPSV